MTRGIAAALFAALALTAATAAAEEPPAEPTRPEYVQNLETICKPRTAETERAVKGLRGDLEAERLKAAARKFTAAGRIFDATLNEIEPVPQPPADRPKLATWFGYLGQQQDYLRQIVKALHAGQAIRTQRLTARFVHNGNLANRTVLAFGFHYCSFQFSRYK